MDQPEIEEVVVRRTIDPEVRAHIYSLVSALGGTGADEQGRYIFGDEALACLKDLKKWLRLYDQRSNRLDVARCIAEANVVQGDLLAILASWSDSGTGGKLRAKMALACIELLVPLTWPYDKNETDMTVNHHRHMPYLQRAQLSYKRAILEHDSGCILRTAVRTGLPSIAMPMKDRSTRDEGIIKLLLYFFRNVAMIAAPPNLPLESDQGQVSRSATIEAFQQQDVLALLLTMISNVGDDFHTQDTVILELLFHLIKGVEVEKLFLDKKQLRDCRDDELKSLLSQEAHMHRGYAKHAPTRHNRFGTMIWVQRDDAGRHSTVSGQEILKDGQDTLFKMDQSKKWNKPKRRTKDVDNAPDRFDLPVPLSEAARTHLRMFVEEILDSGFNPLFTSLRRAVEREADRVLDIHKLQLFYLVGWFLQAERIRRKMQLERRQRDSKLGRTFEPDSFGIISSVLIQEFFVLLNRFMQNALDMKSWRDLQAGMRCFSQILLIVQDMADSPLEEDQEIAENIQNRIFYEETTHDRIIVLLKSYKDQGLGYLDACTELAHVFLRVLERYSKENVDLQIRSKRRRRNKVKAKTQASTGNEPPADGDVEPNDTQQELANENAHAHANASEEEDDEEEDARKAQVISKERKFDMQRFAAKFMTQTCVDTFVKFARYFNDLNQDQLKRIHRFFYRLAFKHDLSIMLFRLDIIALLYKMIKGPEGLDPKSPMYREWDELVRQLIRKLVKKMHEREELAVELLFSKIPTVTFFLEHGYEKQTSKLRSAVDKESNKEEVRTNAEHKLSSLLDAAATIPESAISWIVTTLEDAAVKRRITASLSDADADRTPQEIPVETTESAREALTEDSSMIKVLRLIGCTCPESEVTSSDPSWVIPANMTADRLEFWAVTIREHHAEGSQLSKNEKVFADAVSRLVEVEPTPPRRKMRAAFDDESEDVDEDENDEQDFLFPPGGPTDTVNKDGNNALENLKQKRRKRQRRTDDAMDDERQEERRKAKAAADLNKRRAIKSAQFVHDSDDDTDEERDREFFAQEASRRLGQRAKIAEALEAGRIQTGTTTRSEPPLRKKARQSIPPTRVESEVDSSEDRSQEADLFDSGLATIETPLSSPGRARFASVSVEDESGKGITDLALAEGHHSAEELGPAAQHRRRKRQAFLDDSDEG